MKKIITRKFIHNSILYLIKVELNSEYAANFSIYVEQFHVNNRLFFKSKIENNSTDDFEKAEQLITGFVKWDGCINISNIQDHFCGISDLETSFILLKEAFNVCAWSIPQWDQDEPRGIEPLIQEIKNEI